MLWPRVQTPPPPPPHSMSPEKSFRRRLRHRCSVRPSGSCPGGEWAVHIEWYISMEMDRCEVIRFYGGHGFCHKFIALSLLCTVTFVDREEGQPSMRFRCAKQLSGAFSAKVCLVLLARRRVNPPPLQPSDSPPPPPPRVQTPPPLLRSNAPLCPSCRFEGEKWPRIVILGYDFGFVGAVGWCRGHLPLFRGCRAQKRGSQKATAGCVVVAMRWGGGMPFWERKVAKNRVFFGFGFGFPGGFGRSYEHLPLFRGCRTPKKGSELANGPPFWGRYWREP